MLLYVMDDKGGWIATNRYPALSIYLDSCGIILVGVTAGNTQTGVSLLPGCAQDKESVVDIEVDLNCLILEDYLAALLVT